MYICRRSIIVKWIPCWRERQPEFKIRKDWFSTEKMPFIFRLFKKIIQWVYITRALVARTLVHTHMRLLRPQSVAS